ncbi:MAG: 2-hydroxymuconate tautomerase [Acidobacteriota bacterium]|nr:2-hydroxymuconate tautomerase [Acidobacteriota bacterium]
MLILRKETVMPLIEVHLLEGRSPEQKRALLEGITRAVQDSIGASLESIRVWIHEFSNEEYMAGGVLAADKKKKEKA